MKKKNIYALDRDGGREKISRAMYSPQAFRRENAKNRSGRNWSALLAVVIGVIVAVVFHAGI